MTDYFLLKSLHSMTDYFLSPIEECIPPHAVPLLDSKSDVFGGENQEPGSVHPSAEGRLHEDSSALVVTLHLAASFDQLAQVVDAANRGRIEEYVTPGLVSRVEIEAELRGVADQIVDDV